jgi:hypothetical protein
MQTLVQHKAVIPTAHLRWMLNAQKAMEVAAGLARVMALVWVVTVAGVEFTHSVTYCYFVGAKGVAEMPPMLGLAGTIAFWLALVPGRFFRRKRMFSEDELQAESVAVAHEQVAAAQGALTIYYAFGALLVVSEVAAIMATIRDHDYTLALVANMIALVVYCGPMLRKV